MARGDGIPRQPFSVCSPCPPDGFGQCCGFPVEGYQNGGQSNGTSGGSAISAEARHIFAWYLVFVLVQRTMFVGTVLTFRANHKSGQGPRAQLATLTEAAGALQHPREPTACGQPPPLARSALPGLRRAGASPSVSSRSAACRIPWAGWPYGTAARGRWAQPSSVQLPFMALPSWHCSAPASSTLLPPVCKKLRGASLMPSQLLCCPAMLRCTMQPPACAQPRLSPH